MDNNMFTEEQTQPTTQYEAPVSQPESDLEEPVTLGQWMLTYLIMMIPCVNIVMMFVWAFSKTEKKSKSNYFKATLIWTAIMFGISILFTIVIGAAGAAALSMAY